jgi:hypothetical protein
MRSRTLLALLAAPTVLLVYSRYVRPWQLSWGATPEELSRPLPSDELVTRPTFNATRAITIAAPPEEIWPWLVQVGLTRAGWYSYDILDNPEPRPRRRHPDEPRRQTGHERPLDRRASFHDLGHTGRHHVGMAARREA